MILVDTRCPGKPEHCVSVQVAGRLRRHPATAQGGQEHKGWPVALRGEKIVSQIVQQPNKVLFEGTTSEMARCVSRDSERSLYDPAAGQLGADT